MSKRFGRNQRRRTREALAAEQQRVAHLQDAMQLDRKLIEHQRSRIDEAEGFQREVASMVGRQAIIAGVPVEINLGKTTFDQADRWRLIPTEPMPCVTELSGSLIEMSVIRDETLRLLDIELVADPLRRQMQAWVRIAGAEVCYGITESAFRGMTDQELMRQLVEPVARQLSIELKRRFR